MHGEAAQEDGHEEEPFEIFEDYCGKGRLVGCLGGGGD